MRFGHGWEASAVVTRNSYSVGVIWSLELRSFIRRAAVCSTEDKGCSVLQ